MFVPGLSAPGKLSGVSLAPPESRVKFAATAVPPLSLTTCLITMSCGAMSSFVTVQVFVSPAAMVPLQSADRVAAYPDGPVSETLYGPGSRVTLVPGLSAPGNDAGLGLPPVTDIV